MDLIDTAEKLAALNAFAQSFGHAVHAARWPLIAFRFGDRPWHAYAQFSQAPVIFSAWHTDQKICSPRDVIDTCKHIKGWMQIQCGGGFFGVPTDTKTFTPEVMGRLGTTRCNTELYEALA